VACTRARDSLTLFSPETLYSRELSATTPARVSPFLQDIPAHLMSRYREQFTGGVGLQTLPSPKPAAPRPGSCAAEFFVDEPPRPKPAGQTPVQGTYARHKIFGRGKVVQRVEPNKYKINFPGFGLKLIIEDFVELE
jgi:DNA helicase-2/ATP-dependent DNA helicase PcrA